jgi:protein involved in ribonucleotide reduction
MPMPVPRQEVFNTYWHFAAERQAVFYRRAAGLDGPWTSDPIIGNSKFCNSFRASDRVSQHLISSVLYNPALSTAAEDIVVRAIMYRLFNKSETWDLLVEQCGEPTAPYFQREDYAQVLTAMMKAGEKVFGGAFILCANDAFGFASKHENYLALIANIIHTGGVQHILGARSLREVYEILISYPLIGKFMAYQIAIDINYSDAIDFDESSFTMAGPGAERGIAKCFTDRGGYSNEDIIMWVKDVQAEYFELQGINPEHAWLWGRPLQAIDCQNLFCETDKYCRVAFPELASNRTKIKSTFKKAGSHITLFYPPKWGINHLLDKVPAVPPI